MTLCDVRAAEVRVARQSARCVACVSFVVVIAVVFFCSCCSLIVAPVTHLQHWHSDCNCNCNGSSSCLCQCVVCLFVAASPQDNCNKVAAVAADAEVATVAI